MLRRVPWEAFGAGWCAAGSSSGVIYVMIQLSNADAFEKLLACGVMHMARVPVSLRFCLVDADSGLRPMRTLARDGCMAVCGLHMWRGMSWAQVFG